MKVVQLGKCVNQILDRREHGVCTVQVGSEGSASAASLKDVDVRIYSAVGDGQL